MTDLPRAAVERLIGDLFHVADDTLHDTRYGYVSDIVKRAGEALSALLSRVEELEGQLDPDLHQAALAEKDAEIERLRQALVMIAGKKTYADDPWSIAKAALEQGER